MDKNLNKKTCRYCKKEFTPSRKNQKYCSKKCNKKDGAFGVFSTIFEIFEIWN